MKIKPPKFIRRLMPDLIWEIEDNEGVFLTFDDGPTPGVTEWILATLKRYDAKATFFVLGKNVEMYPDLYQLILKEGHKVGNHTYSHQKGWSMSLERYIEDIDFAGDIVHSELFRHAVRTVKAYSVDLVAQSVRIGFCYINACRAPTLIYFYGGRRAEKVAEEHHSGADSRLRLEVLAYLFRLFEAYSRNVREPIGVVFKHVESFVSKLLYYL